MQLILLAISILVAVTVLTPSAIAQDIRAIQFDKKSYTMNDEALIIVTDTYLNISREVIEPVKLHIYSTSDTRGIMLTLVESDASIDIFEGSLKFTDSPGIGAIKAKPGDTVRAVYHYREPSGAFCFIFTEVRIGNQSMDKTDTEQSMGEPECVTFPLGHPEPVNLRVVRYEIDPLNKSLFGIVKDVKENASLTLTIDRNLIDAKDADSRDVDFVISLDNKMPAAFSELSKNDTHRIIKIEVPEGTERFDIIGTNVLPEFSSNLLAILMTMAFLGTLVFFRIKYD